MLRVHGTVPIPAGGAAGLPRGLQVDAQGEDPSAQQDAQAIVVSPAPTRSVARFGGPGVGGCEAEAAGSELGGWCTQGPASSPGWAHGEEAPQGEARADPGE